MIALEAVLLATALTGAGDAVLLNFSMDHCGACVQMQSTVARLEKDGFPVRKINLSQNRSWARHYQVKVAPTFVMIAGGREIDRVVGATSYARLKRMFESAGVAGPAAAPALTSPAAAPTGPDAKSSEQIARAATVRIRVKDGQGVSVGTGTIIDQHDGEALVLTCGHLFRDSRGKGAISVDLNFRGQRRTVAGRLISYDADYRDIAALMIRPGVAVKAAKVAPPGLQPRVGDRVFSVGCDGGADPSVRSSRITAVNKYMGAPNIEAAGAPVDGRSGGGLYSQDGKLIGVCNAADPQSNEGLYAALATLHWQLDQIGQSRIYRPNNEQLAVEPAAKPTPPVRLAEHQLPQMPSRMPATDLDQRLVPVTRRGAAGLDRAATGDHEVIVIIRSRSNPTAGETIVLSNPSPQLLAQIRRHNIADSESYAARGAATRPAAPPRASPVVRGQSGD